ncbi:hypothetical protein PAPYR_9842 [Paratrimastix pyriformis]|uniref:Uncharacterized protein n=1 Tax=Paratrimastix pyriformis TaxID=342808 RepID=A0ABQ8UEJ1_9EUKA|nr:hypothetical protein PAPYR_9842 [Paratrimastix pyriformis]
MQLEVGSTGERSTAVLVTPGSTPAGPVAPFFDFESSLPPLMGMEPTGLGSPDEPEVSSGATSVSRGLFTPPSQEPLAPALPSHSKEPEDHPPSPGTRGEDIETLLEPNAPDDVLDDILWQVPADWYCRARTRRRCLAGLRLRSPVEASLRGTPVLEVIGAAVAAAAHPSTTTAVDIRPVVTAVSRDMPHIRARRGAYADASELMLAVLSAARRPDLFRASPREHLPAGEQPGPLRVDKCSCGGQLRELSAVKPAPVLVVTVDKLAGVIARAFKTGRLEREGWPSFRLVGGLRHIGSPPLATKRPFSGPTTGPSSTSPGRGGPRDVTTAATILKAAPGQQLRRPPHPVSRPSGTAHPGYSTHLSSTIGPDSTGRPREQLLAPPVDRPASPADVSPSPSDQATTNTPEEEHQDHTGAPLNHNRPRSSEDFVIFYPRGRQGEMDKGPKPVALYFPDGAPDGLTPAPTAVRTSREGQAWAVFSSLEDATAARAGASTRVAWSKATAARLNLPPEATSPRLPQAPSTRAAAATPAGATAIRAENTETDDEAGTDEAETGPRGGGSPTPEERPSQNCATDPPRDARTSEHSPTDKRHGLPPRPYSSFPTACPWPSSPLPMAAPFATKSGTTDNHPSQCAAATSCLHLSRQAPNTPTGPPRHTSMEGKVPTLYLLSDRRRHVTTACSPGRTADPGPPVAPPGRVLGPPLEQIRQLEDLLHRPDSGCGFRKPVTVKQTVGALCSLLARLKLHRAHLHLVAPIRTDLATAVTGCTVTHGPLLHTFPPEAPTAGRGSSSTTSAGTPSGSVALPGPRQPRSPTRSAPRSGPLPP